MHNPVARTLRIVVFSLLLASASVAILFSERLWRLWGERQLPEWAPLSAPITFALFMLVFAADRLWAVQRQHYPPTRALIQVGAACLLLTLLFPPKPTEQALPVQAPDILERPSDDRLGLWPAQLLLQYEDDTVRQATCELLAGEVLGLPHPMPPGHPLEALRGLLVELSDNDPAPQVRAACTQALSQLGPIDTDGLEGDDESCPLDNGGYDGNDEDEEGADAEADATRRRREMLRHNSGAADAL